MNEGKLATFKDDSGVHEIHKFKDNVYMNKYGVNKDGQWEQGIAGSFDNREDALRAMHKHRPTAIKVKEGAEGKRQPGFEFVIYLDEEPNKIIAIRSTGVEAEYYANKRNAGNGDDSVSFERVPKGRFKVGDSFQGPFDDNWKSVKEW